MIFSKSKFRALGAQFFLRAGFGLICCATAHAQGALPAPENLRLGEPSQNTELGEPYQHVTFDDIGVTVGVGVIAPAPTANYTGPSTITVDGTLVENVKMGCVDVRAKNVTFRNVDMTCGGYVIDLRSPAENFTLEYSRIHGTSFSKNILTYSGGFHGATIRFNEFKGGEDWIMLHGSVDGSVVEYNVMHSITSGKPSAHSDGLQIGEGSDAYGVMTIRGNYVWPNTNSGTNGFLFTTGNGDNDIYLYNNFFRDRFGYYTLRCYKNPNDYCEAHNNTFSNWYKGSNDKHQHSGVNVFNCNRYEDGTFSTRNNTSDASCPDYPN